MATRLQIWSGVIAELVGGGLRSNALDDEGNPTDRNARTIARIYPLIVDDALTLDIWPWTVRRVGLAATATPDGAYRYRHAAPAGLPSPDPQNLPNAQQPIIGAGPVALYDGAQAQETTRSPWKPEGADILSDVAQMWAEYQFRVWESAWPQQFAEYVRLRVCASTARAYTGQASDARDYHGLAKQKLQDVIDSVNQVRPPQVLFQQFQTTAHRGGEYFRDIELGPDGRVPG